MQARFVALLLLSTMLFLMSCTGVTVSTPPQPIVEAQPAEPEAQPEAAEASSEETAAEADETTLQHIDLGVGFIPNIQFAPLYVADKQGFYAEEGLEVALEYGFENDFVALTAQGERQFAVASGDQVILAGAQGLPLVYVMKWYERFPVGVVALAETGIDSPAALNGHKVGIPGLFGASYVAWKGLDYATDLDESTVQLESIGFTQASAVQEKLVDAAVVYLANEPVQLAEAGLEVNVIDVSDYMNLVSNGIVTNQTVIQENPDLIRALVKATLRGLQYTIENPDEAFEISREYIPDMTDEDAPVQQLVLERSIEQWRSDQPGISSAEAWETSANLMLEAGLIEAAVEVDKLYTNDFVEK
jgi:NitT/TauT family transport system substrate-binding protein